ncbi:hypothetical protein PTSG_05605 [Salpingoeca rosetta]|uniref:ubiquitinyl hydrolase 1 n=1 Tax=Salpingoeca rosetta (strain ATCC 50818 / BSB-021) TaxID=946362 RepID=F2UBP3_SALR5|nr:uncharacterized protein PTSG_05605 [Salpingoeca rosetta]EGD73909.1 hypothetical protein PTSG_05605 [Salpingoeca rosetta]|eukprot:XP_004993472.1 hypothetical protein PTSG_05605 [Salpingoeca rosetta]
MAAVQRATEVIWGTLKTDREITFRWLQGFEFAESEPTALHQRRGGPCGIIAPVQGMVLRHLLFPNDDGDAPGNWRSPQDVVDTLVRALTDILVQARPTEDGQVTLANLDAPAEELEKYAKHVSSRDQVVPPESELTAPIAFLEQHIAVMDVDADDAEAFLLSMLNAYNGPFGVLLFVYSLVLTRGPDQVELDQGIAAESLVSTPFGHAKYASVSLTAVWCLRRTPVERARRIFAEFDAAGNGFIEAKQLEALLGRLDIDTSTENVVRLSEEMVSDGIILLPQFLSVLYPNQTASDVPKEFTVYFYNGIAKPGEQISYHRGVARSDSPRDFGQVELMQVLWTKWDPLCVKWDEGKPSIT